jgi:hypothetical protein
MKNGADRPQSSIHVWSTLTCSIIGGTTPSYLNSFLPEGAWDQGFTSRTIFVYSGEAVRVSIFGEGTLLDEELHQPLLADLKRIAGLYGKLSWDADAAHAIQAWADADLPPVPEHNKLQHYNTRRLAHVIKLCMVASVARCSDLRITLDDYQTALDWLLEAEGRLPDLFHSHGVAGDSAAIDDAWDFVYRSPTSKKGTSRYSSIVSSTSSAPRSPPTTS